jgi:hypothetical protein
MCKRKWLSGAWTLACIVALAATAAAGGPDAVGSLVGSRNATLDGQRPLPHTVLLSGDKLQVNDGLAMVTLDRGNRMVLGGESEASFLREAGIVTVLMNRGNLSLYHPQGSSGFKVKVGDVTVTPSVGPRTLAEIALTDGLLVVTAKDGSLKVEKGGATREVAKGHTMTVPTTAGRSRSPAPAGNASARPVFNHGIAVAIGAVSAGGGATAASIALTRHSSQVSPITPAP